MTLFFKFAAPPMMMRMSFSPSVRRFSPPPLLLKTTRVVPASGRLLVLAAAAAAPAPPEKKENGGGEEEEEKKLKKIAVKQISESVVENMFKAFIGMGSWLIGEAWGFLQEPTTKLGAWVMGEVLGLMKLVVPHVPRLCLPFIPTILVGASIVFTVTLSVFFNKTMKKETPSPVQPSEKEAAAEQPNQNEEREDEGSVGTSASVKNGKKVS